MKLYVPLFGATYPDSHYMEKRLTGTATPPTAESGGSRGERPDAVAEVEGQGSNLKECVSEAAPNNRMQVTGNSVRSFLAPTISRT